MQMIRQIKAITQSEPYHIPIDKHKLYFHCIYLNNSSVSKCGFFDCVFVRFSFLSPKVGLGSMVAALVQFRQSSCDPEEKFTKYVFTRSTDSKHQGIVPNVTPHNMKSKDKLSGNAIRSRPAFVNKKSYVIRIFKQGLRPTRMMPKDFNPDADPSCFWA